MTERELKKEIKKLRKSIKDFKPRSKERREVKARITTLKAELKALEGLKDEKRPLIEAILKLDPIMQKININLYKHSIEDLKKYLNKLKAINKGDK